MSINGQMANKNLIKIERCVYCNSFIENENVLQCQSCKGSVHIKCLPNSSTPGDLVDDIFFDFTCIQCVRLNQRTQTYGTSQEVAIKEVLVRKQLPWIMVIVLVLYNLSIKSKGLSHHGYFHWQNHIANFIEKNWKYLFLTPPRRRKRWIGTVASVLSQYNPEFFLSGTELLNQNGWWKLTHANRTPKYIYMLFEQYCQKRQQERIEKRPPVDDIQSLIEPKKLRNSADSEDDGILMGTCSRAIPYMGRKPKVIKPLNTDEEENRTAVQSNLMDFLAETLSTDDLTMFNSLPGETLSSSGSKHEFIPFLESNDDHANFFELPEMKVEDIPTFSGSTTNTPNFNDNTVPLGNLLNECFDTNQIGTTRNLDNGLLADYDEEDDEEYRPRIVQVTNFQQSQQTSTVENIKSNIIKKERTSEAEQSENEQQKRCEDLESSNGLVKDMQEEPIQSLPPCKPSLFTSHEKRLWPWMVRKDEVSESLTKTENEDSSENRRCLVPMSLYEEAEFLAKMRKIFSLEIKYKLEIPAHIRRFYRKLCIREWKRAHCKPLFDLDSSNSSNRMREFELKNGDTKILDRYQLISVSTRDSKKSFYARLAGSPQHEFFQSPYTKRILHPFIYKSKDCFPNWLKLLCEVQFATTGKYPTRETIDYCYVRPNHIAAVNALLQTLFWPGIDMSECLSYPDYTIVALYKQLVIGCGFLVPDVGYNEAYISFMGVRPGWQRSGIATFMLYHLIQTCLTKDITLHVSATNPAVMLYQKFGFKVEEIVLNFYEKYLPIDSKHSRHALFLRLSR